MINNDIETIIDRCQECIQECTVCNGDPDFDCVDCTEGGKAKFAKEILEILGVENE